MGGITKQSGSIVEDWSPYAWKWVGIGIRLLKEGGWLVVDFRLNISSLWKNVGSWWRSLLSAWKSFVSWKRNIRWRRKRRVEGRKVFQSIYAELGVDSVGLLVVV